MAINVQACWKNANVIAVKYKLYRIVRFNMLISKDYI